MVVVVVVRWPNVVYEQSLMVLRPNIQNAPVVYYGPEAWAVLEVNMPGLGVLERRVHRAIFGSVHVKVVWWRKMDHERNPAKQKFAKDPDDTS